MKHTKKNEKRMRAKSFIEYLIYAHLWPEDSSTILQVLPYLFSEIQLCSIILWFQFSYITSTNHSDFMQSLSQLISILSIHDKLLQFGSQKFQSVIIFIYILHFLIAISLLMTIHGIFTKKSFTTLSRISRNLVPQVHIGFIYWISCYCLLKVASYNQSSNIPPDFLLPETGSRVVHIILVAVSTIIALVWSVSSFGPFRGHNFFASRNPYFQTLGTCTRIIFIIFTAGFENNSKIKIAVVILTSLLLITRVILLCRDLAFYELKALKFCTAMASIQTSIAFSGLISSIIKSQDEVNPAVLICLQIIFTPFVIIFSWRYIENINSLNLARNPDFINSDRDLYRLYFTITNVIASGGLTIQSGKKHIGEYAILYLIEKLKISQDSYKQNPSMEQHGHTIFDLYKEQEQVLYSLLLENMRSHISRKFSNNAKLLLASEMLKRDEFGIALYYLVSIKKEELGIIDKAVFDYLLDTVDNLINVFWDQQNKDVINVQPIVQYESQLSEITSMISEISNEYIKFWKKYSEPNLSVNELVTISSKIEKLDEQLKQLWSHFSANFVQHLSIIAPIYSTYLHQVRNAPWKAEQILSKIMRIFDKQHMKKEVNQIITEDNIDDKNNVVVIVAFSKKDLGAIRYVSKNISALGYQQEKCIGSSLFNLWPPFIQEGHSAAFTSILHKHKLPSTINTKTIGYVKAAAGFSIPVYSYASVHPYIQNEFQYVGIAKPLQLEREFLIVRPSGLIEAWSQRIGEILGLNNIPLQNIDQFLTRKQEKESITQKCSIPHNTLKKDLEGLWNAMTQMLSEQKKMEMTLYSGTNRVKVSGECKKKTFFWYMEIVVFEFEIIELRRISKEDPLETDIPAKRLELNLAKKNVLPNSNNLEKFKYLKAFVQKLIQSEVSSSEQVVKKSHLSILASNNIQEENSSFTRIELENPLPNIANAAEEDTCSISSQLNRNSNKILEEAIYSVKLPRFFKLFYSLILVSSAISLIFLIIVLVTMYKNLKLAMANSDIIQNSYTSMYSFVSMELGSKFLVGFHQGLIAIDRYAFAGVPMVQFIALLFYPTFSKLIHNSNNQLRLSLVNIDENLEQDIYDLKIPIPMNDEIVNLNFFDYSSLVVGKGVKVGSQSPFQDYSINPDVQFFISTLTNGPLTVGGKLADILHQDTDLKLEKGIHLSIAAAIMISAIGIGLLGYLSKHTKSFIDQRDQFIELFLRIDESAIKEAITNTQYFIAMLDESCEFVDFKGRSLRTLTNKTATKTFRKKSANMAHLNRNAFRMGLISLILILLMILGFLIVVIFQQKQNSTFQKQAYYEYTMNKLPYQYSLIIASLYQYIFTNGSGVIENEPVDTHFENLYSKLVQSDLFFGELMNYYSYNETLTDMIKRDLCKYNITTATDMTFCRSIANGALTRGIVGVNKEITSAMRMAKDFFDNSPRTHADQVTAISFSILPQIEMADFSVLIPVYDSVKSGIQENQRLFVARYYSRFTVLIITMIFGFCVLGLMFFVNVKVTLEREMINWRKFIRMIPYKCYARNKMLANHLRKTSGVNI